MDFPINEKMKKTIDVFQINLVFDYTTARYFNNERIEIKDKDQMKLYYVYDNGELKLQDIRHENFLSTGEDF